MNFDLPFIPERPEKSRESGVTMMMDKGISLTEAKCFVESSAEFTDLIKFGFGTSLIAKNLKEKIEVYRNADIKPYFGGSLFELFIARGMYDEFVQFVKSYDINIVEVSDGTITLDHDLKCEYITRLSKEFTVLSEVGSKVADVVIPNDEWVNMMKKELAAGAWKVIAEARESGNVGIYKSDGSANTELIEMIQNDIDPSSILWEAPQKSQQVWFIKHFGPNVNLGNIAVNEVVPLETLRLGLRGDTLLDYIPEMVDSNE